MIRTLLTLSLLLTVAPAWAAGQPTVRVRTAAVKPHALRETITAFGVVRPNPESQTTKDANYTAFVTRVDVTLGQPVKKGDALLELRTAPSAQACTPDEQVVMEGNYKLSDGTAVRRSL